KIIRSVRKAQAIKLLLQLSEKAALPVCFFSDFFFCFSLSGSFIHIFICWVVSVLQVCLSVCPSVCLCGRVSVRLSVCLSVWESVCLSVCACTEPAPSL